MEHNEPHKSLKERVFEAIETGHVTVRSRTAFTLRLVALAVVGILTLAVSIFLCNFILFSLRVSARGPLLGFGFRGFLFFLWFFPWLWLLVDIVLVVGLEMLLRKFRFGYRRPILYTLLALLAITISVSFFIDRDTDFNESLSRRAESHRLPGLFGQFYRDARRFPDWDHGVCRCTITAINGNVLSAEDRDPEETVPVTVIVSPSDPALSSLKVGDTVLVAGDVASGTIRAFGIRPLAPPR